MRKFVKSIRTSKYIIGCTGRTTYIYDLNEQLILKFQDIPYGYTPYVSKDEKYLCVKATALSCNVSLRICNEYKNKTIV